MNEMPGTKIQSWQLGDHMGKLSSFPDLTIIVCALSSPCHLTSITCLPITLQCAYEDDGGDDYFTFYTRYHYVPQAGLGLVLLLPWPLECWDYKYVPL